VKEVYLPIDTARNTLRGVAFVAFETVAQSKAVAFAVKDFMWPVR
jgi:hypothetical protein